MQTECKPASLEFPAVKGRHVVAGFDGGVITTDAGALLLVQADRAIRLTERFTTCFKDVRTWASRWVARTSTTMTSCAMIQCYRCWPASWRRDGRTVRCRPVNRRWTGWNLACRCRYHVHNAPRTVCVREDGARWADWVTHSRMRLSDSTSMVSSLRSMPAALSIVLVGRQQPEDLARHGAQPASGLRVLTPPSPHKQQAVMPLSTRPHRIISIRALEENRWINDNSA